MSVYLALVSHIVGQFGVDFLHGVIELPARKSPVRTSFCPSCNSPVSQADKFCSECGYLLREVTKPAADASEGSPEPLRRTPLAIKGLIGGERKQVTILFADIIGSLELIASRDPEEAQSILDPAIDIMMEAVNHYGGTVVRVLGDGIMSLFGAPTSHEDHAVCACYAALRIQDAIERYTQDVQSSHDTPLLVRVGLNSGETVVGKIGNKLHTEYNAIGQAAHLAARMEQLARPGSILTTEETIRLTEGYIMSVPMGPMKVKGMAEPVEAHEVIGRAPLQTKIQVAARRGFTHFVGRKEAFSAFETAHSLALASKGQALAITGEPGIGKSRIIHEFLHGEAAGVCRVIQCHASSYGRATPYFPIIELLKDTFDISVTDTLQSIREKVVDGLERLDLIADEVAPPLLDLFGALETDHAFRSVDPSQHRQLTYQAITTILLAESEARPLVAVFEDLHWADSLSVGFIKQLVSKAADARLLVLTSYRPEFECEWTEAENAREVELNPLPSSSFVELLATLLGSDPTLDPVKKLLLKRAGGNPFFAEEMVRALVDTGALAGFRGYHRLIGPVSEQDVPPTVQALLAARIDALSPAHKQLLQEAAVIGKQVSIAVLERIGGVQGEALENLMNDLQDGGFLYLHESSGAPEYVFRHSLTQDVAYSGLLHESRRAIHGRVVGAIEALFPERIAEQAERLGEHAFRGQLWEKAVQYLQQSGSKASERQAFSEAVLLFEQALTALTHLPENTNKIERAIDLRFDIRNALQPLGERQRIYTYLSEAKAMAESIGDERRSGWVKSYLTDHFWILGKYRDAVETGEGAIEIAEHVSDLRLQVVSNLPLGLAHHTLGDYPRALEHFGWNRESLGDEWLYERFGMFVLPSAFSRSFMAWSLAELGEFEEGLRIGNEALAIADEAEHPFSRGYAYLGLGVLHLRQGRFLEAIDCFGNAIGDHAFADSPVGFSYVAVHLGFARAVAGWPRDGIALLEETVQVAEARGFVARHALRLAYLGEAYLTMGRKKEAADWGARALALAVEHGERANEAYALRVLAKVEAYSGNRDAAEAHYLAALKLSKKLGLRPLTAHCHRGLAGLLNGRGGAVTVGHNTEAESLSRGMGLEFWDDQASLILGPGPASGQSRP